MKLHVLFAFLGAVALFGAAARADEAGEHAARALFAEGNQKFEAGDYVGALERYRGAYARWPNPKILINIGTMLRQLGRNAEAADTYAAYLRDPQAEAARKAEIEKSLAELDAKVGKLRIIVDDRKAIVRIDGKLIGQPGGVVETRVEPGPHSIIAEHKGAPPAVANVTVVAAKEAIVSLHVQAPSAPSATAPRPSAKPPLVAPRLPGTNARDRANKPAPTLSHRWQVGLVARADFSPQPPGGVLSALGLAFGLWDHVEINTCALLGKNKGVEPGATVFVLKGAWKPRFSVGVPIFIADAARVGMHASAGIQWDPIRYFGVFVDAGVVAFPNAPDGYQKVVFVPSIGVEPRL